MAHAMRSPAQFQFTRFDLPFSESLQQTVNLRPAWQPFAYILAGMGGDKRLARLVENPTNKPDQLPVTLKPGPQGHVPKRLE